MNGGEDRGEEGALCGSLSTSARKVSCSKVTVNSHGFLRSFRLIRDMCYFLSGIIFLRIRHRLCEQCCNVRTVLYVQMRYCECSTSTNVCTEQYVCVRLRTGAVRVVKTVL